MIYEVTARMYFAEKDEAEDFYHDCELAYPKGVDVNPDGVNAEFRFAVLIENHHDESPTKACRQLKSIP